MFSELLFFFSLLQNLLAFIYSSILFHFIFLALSFKIQEWDIMNYPQGNWKLNFLAEKKNFFFLFSPRSNFPNEFSNTPRAHHWLIGSQTIRKYHKFFWRARAFRKIRITWNSTKSVHWSKQKLICQWIEWWNLIEMKTTIITLI